MSLIRAAVDYGVSTSQVVVTVCDQPTHRRRNCHNQSNDMRRCVVLKRFSAARPPYICTPESTVLEPYRLLVAQHRDPLQSRVMQISLPPELVIRIISQLLLSDILRCRLVSVLLTYSSIQVYRQLTDITCRRASHLPNSWTTQRRFNMRSSLLWPVVSRSIRLHLDWIFPHDENFFVNVGKRCSRRRRFGKPYPTSLLRLHPTC